MKHITMDFVIQNMKGRSYLLKTLKRINFPFRNMVVIRNLLSSMCSDKWSSAVSTRNLRDSGLVLVIQQIFVLLKSAFGFRFYIYKRCILYRYTGIEITHDKHGTLAEKEQDMQRNERIVYSPIVSCINQNDSNRFFSYRIRIRFLAFKRV